MPTTGSRILTEKQLLYFLPVLQLIERGAESQAACEQQLEEELEAEDWKRRKERVAREEEEKKETLGW